MCCGGTQRKAWNVKLDPGFWILICGGVSSGALHDQRSSSLTVNDFPPIAGRQSKRELSFYTSLYYPTVYRSDPHVDNFTFLWPSQKSHRHMMKTLRREALGSTGAQSTSYLSMKWTRTFLRFVQQIIPFLNPQCSSWAPFSNLYIHTQDMKTWKFKDFKIVFCKNPLPRSFLVTHFESGTLSRSGQRHWS